MAKKQSDSLALIFFGIAIMILGTLIVVIPFILIAVAIVLLICYLVSTFRFYNRKNYLKKIGATQFLDLDLTYRILSRKGIVNIDEKEANFESIRCFYESSLKSADIRGGNNLLGDDNIRRKAFKKYNIGYANEPIVLRFLEKKKRALIFYIFPKTILAFAEEKEKIVFIGAYTLRVLEVSCSSVVYSVTKVVYEKSKNPIEYYYKYNPVPDAPIVFCDWTVKNIDGSRSFKGGLLPEHNPLIFKLKYAQVNYKMGLLSVMVEYSNYNAGSQFVEGYKALTV